MVYSDHMCRNKEDEKFSKLLKSRKGAKRVAFLGWMAQKVEDALTWMHGRWTPILLVSPARCTESFATFWSAYWKRTRWLGVRAVPGAGFPAAPCGETGVRAPGWTAHSSPFARRWAPRIRPACRRSDPVVRAFWRRRCWMDLPASSGCIGLDTSRWSAGRSAQLTTDHSPGLFGVQNWSNVKKREGGRARYTILPPEIICKFVQKRVK